MAATSPKVNGTPAPPNDKAEKEKQKRKEKKERKDREKAEREGRGEEGDGSVPASAEASTPVQIPKSGKETPISNPPEPSTSAADVDSHTGLKSPTTESTGARTPTSKRAPRNPWTVFMRMTVPANEAELREFFGEAKGGIIRVSYPQSFAGKQQKIAYVEFGDEETMRAGLAQHAEVRFLIQSILNTY